LSKFNLMITEVQLHISSSSAACEKQFKYSVFSERKSYPLKSFLYVPVAQVNHINISYTMIRVYFHLYMASCPHSTTIAMPNSNRSHVGVIPIVYYSWKWFLNLVKFENITLTKKMRNLNIFQTVYHLLHSD
jgi:hypothetical protein